MLRIAHHSMLIGVLLAFVAVATTYNFANPLFEAPDEAFHYLYVRHLSETGTLPRLDDPPLGGLYQQEAFQAPLYYLTAALLTSWAPRDNFAELSIHNFAGSLGNARSTGNRNMSLHGPTQRFPYRGESLTVHLVRLVTTLWGAAALGFTYYSARRVLRNNVLALAATIVVAFTPEFLFMSAAVNNDVPVAAMSALLFWLSIRLAESAPSWSAAIALGVIAGAVILTKSIAAGTVALPIVAIGYCCLRYRVGARRTLLHFGIYGATLILTTGWWFWLNRQTYGSITPLQSFLHRDNLLNEAPSPREFLNDLPGLERSYWAVFGWFNIIVPEPFYQFFELLIGLAGVGLVILAYRWLTQPRPRLPTASGIGIVLAVTGALAVIGAVFAYRVIVLAFHGRLLYGASATFATLFVLGWSTLLPRRWRQVGSLMLALSLAIPALAFPWTVIRPAYAQPAVISGTTPDSARRLDLNLGGELTLLAVTSDLPDGARVKPGDAITVTLSLEARHPLSTNYVLFVQLIDPVRGAIAKIDTHPGHGALPTAFWVPGQTVIDQYRLIVPPDAGGPSVDRIVAGFYREESGSRLPITGAAGEPAGDAATILTLVVAGRSTNVPLSREATFNVGDRPAIALVDHQPSHVTSAAGAEINGSLTFNDISPVTHDYTLFIHLDGANGPVAQADGPPRGGAFPTTAWRPGDVVTHEWKMGIPSGLAPGTYRLTTGWYDPLNGQRLSAGSEDSVDIGDIEVTGP